MPGQKSQIFDILGKENNYANVRNHLLLNGDGKSKTISCCISEQLYPKLLTKVFHELIHCGCKTNCHGQCQCVQASLLCFTLIMKNGHKGYQRSSLQLLHFFKKYLSCDLICKTPYLRIFSILHFCISCALSFLFYNTYEESIG